MELQIQMSIRIQSLVRGYNARRDIKCLVDNATFPMMNKWLETYNRRLIAVKEVNEILKPNDNISSRMSNILAKLRIKKNKKVRNDNFPSHLSENIAKFAIFKKYSTMPSWETDKGDLIIISPGSGEIIKRIEVKAFMSDGPSSFGPTETWDWLYFVDAKDTLDGSFKVYEIKCSNTSEEMKNVQLSGCVFELDNIDELPEDIDNDKKWKIGPLKELCKSRGLKLGGRKSDIVHRLKNEAPGSKHKPLKTFGDIVEQKRRGELRGSFEKIFKPHLGENCKLIFDGHISELNPCNFKCSI